MAEARGFEIPELGFDGGIASDIGGAVDFLCDRLHFVAQLHVVGIKRLEVRLALIDDLDDVVGELLGAFAAVGPVRAQERLCSHALGGLLDFRDFRVCVGDEFVDRDNSRNAELVDVLDVALQVVATFGNRRGVFGLEIIFGDTAVHLQGADRCDDDDGGRCRCRPCGT